MPNNQPPSIASTEAQAPQSLTRSVMGTAGSSTTHVDLAPRRPPLLPEADNSMTMLMRWAYDTRSVTVNEKLHRDAAQQMRNGDDRR